MTLFKAKPICAHCGKKYGQRDTDTQSVLFPATDPTPVYRGNLEVVREEVRPWSRQMREEKSADYMRPRLVAVGPEQNRVTWTLWDGTYRAPYHPFCTMRCALAYARAAWSRK